MGAGGTDSDIPDELIKEWSRNTKESYIRLGKNREELPDDVFYNQKWWEQYCKDHNLDSKSGKSLSSIFLSCRPLF